MRSWRELAAAAAEPNPFYEPEYVLPLARALGEQEQVALLVVAENGALATPACPCAGSGAGTASRCPRSWAGADAALLPALLGTPLVHRDHLASATAALLRFGARAEGSWFFVLDSLGADGPVHGAIEDSLATEPLWSQVFSADERAFLNRRERNDYLHGDLPAQASALPARAVTAPCRERWAPSSRSSTWPGIGTPSRS